MNETFDEREAAFQKMVQDHIATVRNFVRENEESMQEMIQEHQRIKQELKENLEKIAREREEYFQKAAREREEALRRQNTQATQPPTAMPADVTEMFRRTAALNLSAADADSLRRAARAFRPYAEDMVKQRLTNRTKEQLIDLCITYLKQKRS